jgi:hypothetical protein
VKSPRRSIATALGALAVLALVAAPLAAGESIDQTPIVRVLRTSDVPGSGNAELPSGALELEQLIAADAKVGPGRAAEKAALRAGFKSAAISQFGGPDSRALTSFAVEYGSAGEAKEALGREAGALVGAASGLVGRQAVKSLPGGLAITYRGSAKEPANEVVVLAREGSWLFSLRGSGDHGGSSRSFVAKLLGVVVARQ